MPCVFVPSKSLVLGVKADLCRACATLCSLAFRIQGMLHEQQFSNPNNFLSNSLMGCANVSIWGVAQIRPWSLFLFPFSFSLKFLALRRNYLRLISSSNFTA